MRLVTISVTVSDQPQQLPTPAIALLDGGFVNARFAYSPTCGDAMPIAGLPRQFSPFLSLLFPKLTIVHLVNSAHSIPEQACLRRAD